jgi:hypothetical protein
MRETAHGDVTKATKITTITKSFVVLVFFVSLVPLPSAGGAS